MNCFKIGRFTVLLLAVCIAGCTTLTSPPATVVSNASDYFWPWQGATYTFVDNAGATRTLALAVDSTRLDLTDALDPDNTISFTNVSGDIGMQGASLKSFFPMPSHSDFFSKFDTVVSSTTTFHPVSILTSESFPILLGTDSGEVFHNDFGHADSCFTDGGPWGASVLAFSSRTASGPTTAYAGTTNSGVWKRAGAGLNSIWTNATYNLPSGAVTAMVGDRADHLYAAVAGSGIWSFSGTAWTQLIALPTERVNTMFPMPSSDAVLVGTSMGRTGTISPSGTIAWAAPLSTAAQLNAVQCFGAFPTGAVVFAGTLGDGLFASTDIGKNWIRVTSGPKLIDVRGICIVQYPSPHMFLLTGGTSGALYSLSTSGVPTLLHAVRNGIAIASIKYLQDSLFLLTQDYGLLTSYTGSATNVTIHQGHFVRLNFDDTPGPLTLLKTSMTRGARWRAGTLMRRPTDESRLSFPVYAQVLDELDSLRLGASTFKNIMVVRYAFERAQDQPVTDNLPYWVMYFGHSQGPIMLEEIRSSGGAPPTVVYRLSR